VVDLADNELPQTAARRLGHLVIEVQSYRLRFELSIECTELEKFDVCTHWAPNWELFLQLDASCCSLSMLLSLGVGGYKGVCEAIFNSESLVRIKHENLFE